MRASTALSALALTAYLAVAPAIAQLNGLDPRQRKPVTQQTAKSPQRAGLSLSLPAPRIDRWSVVGHPGQQDGARTGDTLRLEGPALDVEHLQLETRLGDRSIRFPRQPGGSSDHIDFLVPTDAITGGIGVTLQASTPGSEAAVLSTAFGVCDHVNIYSAAPTAIGYNPKHLNAEGQPLLNRKALLLRGECLRDLSFERLGAQRVLRVGGGMLVIGGIRSTAFSEVVLELDRFIPPRGASRAEGHLQLITPARGPKLIVEDAFTLQARGIAP